jgi:8-oxo-dGTP pyrophosphatase MutT (NUDIX family)
MKPEYLMVVECILEHNDKILVIRRPTGVHGGGLLAFPGGKVDLSDGENQKDILLEAAKREVFEELNLTLVDPVQYITSSHFIDSYGNSVIDCIFYCKLKKTIISINAAIDEVPEYFWLTKEEILQHKDTPVWLRHYMTSLNTHQKP